MKLELKTRLSQLADLDEAALGAFNVEVIDALGSMSEMDSAEAIGELTALQSAGDLIRREFARREPQPSRAAALDGLEPEPLAAAGGRGRGMVARMAARQPRPTQGPEASAPRAGAVLTATAAMRDWDHSKPIVTRYELARAMSETLRRMSKSDRPRGDVVLASARWQYPEDRRLTDSQERNAELMDAVCHPTALLASGGTCAPTNVDYDMSTWACADRPLRDGLPGFLASRGGLLYVQPPDIGIWAGATSVWTEATDASPGASVKPVMSMTCGNTVQVFVNAIPTRIGFGNMQARFAPEQVAANTDVAMAQAARTAENELLSLIAAACVADVTTAVLLGATRDLLTAVDQVCAAYRSAHRISRSQALTAIFPDWVKDLIRADLVRELAHGQNDDWNSLAVSDDQIEELLMTHGVKPIFHIDGQPNTVAGGDAQTFVVQTASTGILTFPGKMVWYLFAEGQIQFLDGGRLDLGVVRDSTLDATNDFEVFVEPFESLAFRGFSSGALQLVSSLCANGTSAATTSTASDCA
jgi:hypothetical protein